jgi:hypothetical protein
MRTKTSKRKLAVEEIRYADSIKTDNRGMVRLSELSPDDTVVIQGRSISAKMIPLSNYTLECGHTGQGIAVTNGRAFYCEVCKDTKFVARVRT